MGLLGAIKHLAEQATNAVSTVLRTVDEAAKAVVPGYAQARDFVSKLIHGDLGDQAVPMPEVIQKVIAGNSGDWHSAATKADDVASTHARISTDINSISAGLEAAWTGRAADAAQTRIKPFADVVATAAQSFTDNSNNLKTMAHYFDSVQSAFKAQPLPPRPDKDFFDIATPWNTDTENQVTKYNALVQQHLERYNKYADQAAQGRSQLKLDYGRVDPFAGADFTVTGGPGAPSTPGGPGIPGVGVGETPGFTGATGVTNPSIAGPRTGTMDPTSGVPNTPVRTPGVDVAPPDYTRTAGFVPPEFGGAPPFPAGGGGSGTNVPGIGSGIGAVGGLGGRAGTGSGVGTGGPGKATGAGGPGANTGTGAGRPGANALGRVGTPGAPGFAGTPAGRGRGEEDEEHRDKYAQEDDSLFSLGGESGETLIDPSTGLAVPPPTIGG